MKRPRTNSRWRSLLGRLPALVVMSVVALIILYPLQIILFTSVKTEAELVRNPLGWPQVWTGANFVRAWVDARMGSLMGNSLITSACVSLFTVLMSSFGGFALARLSFPGRMVLPILLTIGLVLPFETLMIPLFYTFRSLHLLDSYAAMILPQVGLGLPFGILLLRGFIGDLPQEYFDAAEIDGCGLWGQFRYLILPLSQPALVTLAVFQFLWSWNQYLVALVMVQNSDLRTIPLGLSFFVGRYQSSYAALAAAAVVAFLPTFALYAVFHRQVLKANLAGGLKY